MALSVGKAFDRIRIEAQNETERNKLFVLAHNKKDLIAELKETEVVSVLRQLEEPSVGQKRSPDEARIRGLEDGMTWVRETLKKTRTSVTNIIELGEQVLDDADAMALRLFESRIFAPHEWISLKRVAEALGEPYKRLKALSAQRQDKGKTPLEEPVQTFSRKMYEVFQEEHKRGRTVVGDTSATGLWGAWQE
jgi:hypothetical protein